MEPHSIPGAIRPGDRTTNRLQRFAEWGPVQRIGEIGSIEELESEPFYYGKALEERMPVIREAIGYVRKNWHNYEMLMDGLRVLLKKRLGDPLPVTGDAEYLHRLLSSSIEWNDNSNELIGNNANDYSAIRLYASTFGHQAVFKIINNVLRENTNSPEQREELNAAVFLVELLNVDLFNYVSLVPQANNFQGVIFRALASSNNQLQSFKELAAKLISERFWAVPLALFSASRNQATAVAFAKEDVQQHPENHLLLWRIHVVELEAELLRVYKERFPSSVVSTICAVPIHQLSLMHEEEEVVLRGPFFQLIRMQEEMIEGLGSVHVMDSCMVTINRDHPSTMKLDREEWGRAQELIACLVGIGRMKACKRLATDFGMVSDVPIYDQLINKEEEQLRSIIA